MAVWELQIPVSLCWVTVKELTLSFSSREALLFTIHIPIMVT